MTAEWWRGAVIYQVYPRSFQDTNGDGIGDLPGIMRRLDHIASLGVDAIWLSPINQSPQADMGYDIADYKVIDERYGSLEDVDEMIAELRALDPDLVRATERLHPLVERPRRRLDLGLRGHGRRL